MRKSVILENYCCIVSQSYHNHTVYVCHHIVYILSRNRDANLSTKRILALHGVIMVHREADEEICWNSKIGALDRAYV